MTQGRWRIADLARLAGISVQQVRNYVDQEVLPPVGRAENGYRVFTDAHARALTVARALAEGHGWERTRIIMSAVNQGRVEQALSTVDSSHAELARERLEIERVLQAFQTVVADSATTPNSPTTSAPTGRLATIGEVADSVGVRTSALRLWEQSGLLRPGRRRGTGYRVYDAAELRNARIIALLRRGSYPLPVISAVLAELRSGSSERVRAELASREQELHRRSLLRLRGSAALSSYLEDLT